MRRRAVWALALLLLAGCGSSAREPGNLALVRAVGADGEHPLVLLAVSGGEEIFRGRVEAENFSRARQALPWSGERKLSLTGVSHLIVGPEVDLECLLLRILEDAEVGGTPMVWLAPEGAEQLLSGAEDPAAELDLLTRRGIPAPRAAEAAAALMTEGEVSLPSLEAEDGRIHYKEMNLWKSRDRNRADFPPGSWG